MASLRQVAERVAGRLLRPLLGPPKVLAQGSAAPAFEVSDHRGRLVKLTDLLGRRTVLWFYPRASTSG